MPLPSACAVWTKHACLLVEFGTQLGQGLGLVQSRALLTSEEDGNHTCLGQLVWSDIQLIT